MFKGWSQLKFILKNLVVFLYCFAGLVKLFENFLWVLGRVLAKCRRADVRDYRPKQDRV
jgi:hypothetical protein